MAANVGISIDVNKLDIFFILITNAESTVKPIKITLIGSVLHRQSV